MSFIGTVFLLWADVQGTSQSGWEFSTTVDVFFLLAGRMTLASNSNTGTNPTQIQAQR